MDQSIYFFFYVAINFTRSQLKLYAISKENTAKGKCNKVPKNSIGIKLFPISLHNIDRWETCNARPPTRWIIRAAKIVATLANKRACIVRGFAQAFHNKALAGEAVHSFIWSNKVYWIQIIGTLA